jgi:choline dehydrogenase-like flavoprotein
MLEAGFDTPRRGQPDILAADITEPAFHDPVEVVSASALGGTSHWWGGRAVSLDPVDFRNWPINYSEMRDWYDAAAEFLGAKANYESPAPGSFADLGHFDAISHETWCPQTNMAKRWYARLTASVGPAVVLGARVIGILHAGGQVTGLRVRIGQEERIVRANHVVLACGGLGCLRLLLLAQRHEPSLFGGIDGPLGRDYVGHLTGVIAELEPHNIRDSDAFAFRTVGSSIFARRRLRTNASTIIDHRLPNTAFWIDNAGNENPLHRSPTASAKYLVTCAVQGFNGLVSSNNRALLKQHFQNVGSAPLSALAGLGRAGCSLAIARLSNHHPPRSGHFLPARSGAWIMRYHAEQFPDSDNRVSLTDRKTDSLGLPSLQIKFSFSQSACEAVVRTHELLNADLQRSRAGRLHWYGPRDDCVAMVRSLARDGYHQIGGAAMSKTPDRGVVDSKCRTFGIENLWVASSCVFPSGGHANPTLTIVALALRIAASIASGYEISL